jgi:putative FmdB family regulatory protein
VGDFLGYNTPMPLFEYTCNHCRKRFTVLVGMTAAADTNICPHCGYDQATKRVTRFARGRSEEALMDDLADPDKLGDMDDPKAMRRWAKELSKEMGEDLGDDFEEYMDAAESGEDDEASSMGAMPQDDF